MEMENEKTKNMETDVYLCLMEFDNKDVDSYSYVTDGLGMVKIVFVCKNFCQQEAISKANDFSLAKIVSAVNKLQRCRREPLEACNSMSRNKILCSFTTILHRDILFREHDQLKFLFSWLQEKFRVSDANKIAKRKKQNKTMVITTYSNFLQTPNSILKGRENPCRERPQTDAYSHFLFSNQIWWLRCTGRLFMQNIRWIIRNF